MNKNRKKTGRPSKLNLELEAEIVELIKLGNYVETACGVVGIGKQRFIESMKKAKASVRYNKYVRFRNAVEKAQAWSEARDIAIITRPVKNIGRQLLGNWNVNIRISLDGIG